MRTPYFGEFIIEFDMWREVALFVMAFDAKRSLDLGTWAIPYRKGVLIHRFIDTIPDTRRMIFGLITQALYRYAQED